MAAAVTSRYAAANIVNAESLTNTAVDFSDVYNPTDNSVVQFLAILLCSKNYSDG